MKANILLIAITGMLVSFVPKTTIASNDTILAKIDALNACLIELDTLDSRSDIDGEATHYLNEKIKQDLFTLLKLPATQHYPLQQLLHLQSSSTADGQLTIFSFFNNYGGTMWFHTNYVRYYLPNGKMNVELLIVEGDGTELYSTAASHGENRFNNGHIFTIHTLSGLQYLSHGYTVICSSCDSHEWVLMSINKKGLAIEQVVYVEYHFGQGTSVFDTTNMEIRSQFAITQSHTLGYDCNVWQKDTSGFYDVPVCYIIETYCYSNETFLEY
ncbi:hypothetical protein BH09BAC1_BH09BAC1_01960 [soil metagenome]